MPQPSFIPTPAPIFDRESELLVIGTMLCVSNNVMLEEWLAKLSADCPAISTLKYAYFPYRSPFIPVSIPYRSPFDPVSIPYRSPFILRSSSVTAPLEKREEAKEEGRKKGGKSHERSGCLGQTYVFPFAFFTSASRVAMYARSTGVRVRS